MGSLKGLITAGFVSFIIYVILFVGGGVGLLNASPLLMWVLILGGVLWLFRKN